jgi:D-inositol-3-phosphate glycosyltransferase
MMTDEGIRALYAPLGIDTDFWTPGDRSAARAELGIPDGVFMPLFVGNNNTNPSRKGLDQLVLAWQMFLELTPDEQDAVLYLHTSMDAQRSGVDALMILNAIGVMRANWQSTDKAQYESQQVTPEFLRTLYRAADVLVGPSTGEGFWLPGVEAQACGCPVIGCDFAAQRETVRVGWKIAVSEDTGETRWCPLGALRFVPKKRAIVAALQAAAAARDDNGLRQRAHEAVKKYDWRRVFDEHWTPALEQIERLLEGDIEGEKEICGTNAKAMERTGGNRPDPLHIERARPA